ncbi:hypothetical protein [Lutispora thermophila]|uniref:Uncharacterized protein n=1 Tax=Lutispora thermophila DSM 19022 TaxID=1122184 RepID=A0A1M6E9D3_9FIRM|nr:hypothetical protein [Lutispora thermophila]SHI82055.1 hypothetical protein SAMN02745176_01499 [Lutispora thermophila DSM 19022]
MEYKIQARNHWWFDAGIAGLYFIAKKVEQDNDNIEINFDSESLSFRGNNEEDIRNFLQNCYNYLVSQYWNVSTKTQKEKLELVLYNPEKKEFSLAPKRQATPVVSLFVKRFDADGIKYNDMDDVLKAEVDSYLKKTKRKLFGKQNKLVYSLTTSHQNLKILPKENKKQSTCCMCGKKSSNLSDISQPSFLLFASTSATTSFHTQGKKPAKICWECEFISKFTMETVNYKKDDTKLSILLLNSPDIAHNINNQKKIGCSSVLRSIDEEYFYKNIGLDDKGLISKARMSYELLWAYFVDTYEILRSNIANQEVNDEDPFYAFLSDIISSPIEIVIICFDKMRETFLTKEIIFYNDVSYAFRLIQRLIEKGINIKDAFTSLRELDNKGNLKPSRNNTLKKVLNKHCILSDIESITFRKVVSRNEGKFINVSNMLNFLIEYYLVIKEDIMNREQIDVAVKLGKQIVNQAYKESGESKEILKRIKGDLFTLRKTRTVTDFIVQLNALQFRYGISVSNSILEGVLNEVPFEDFKGYCIMGALNSYNYYNSSSKEKEENKDE